MWLTIDVTFITKNWKCVLKCLFYFWIQTWNNIFDWKVDQGEIKNQLSSGWLLILVQKNHAVGQAKNWIEWDFKYRNNVSQIKFETEPAPFNIR